ncbi:ABC transporter substrate-binding protein [Roseicyclus persicicus]|uniref:ABC transporter substrate-binding protein n=1 Tax=Roseicyclus persicicus TaxID=2650661 RepID=A0A7X6K0N1_9RHOB|nr:ABC transporter substrate-binding protein [Roseibacterium persicicum]NKX46063.1 ABC transporter substrate-binding protein [Roseibacterium persicicum]
MKKILMASAATLALAGAAHADAHGGVTLGVLLGFTGPAESLAPGMASGAELAMSEVTESGQLLGGMAVTSARGDSACDATLSVAAAERLITAEGVDGIVGALCSGATIPALTNVAVPNGMVMISPSATSPALSTIEDNGLFFRTAPSDARQGVVMAENIMDRGFTSVAVTYTNNDYGQGLADSFAAAFQEMGGTVTLVASHEENRADYSAEVGALAAAGGEVLVVAGYVDGGGSGIIQAALDSGAFDTFVLPDGMVGAQLVANFGTQIDGSFGQFPGTDSEGSNIYFGLAEAAGFDGTSAFSAEGYDAAALILLAMQAAGSTTPTDYAAHIMDVANAPGEPILPGELGRALELIAAGTDIDYVGATAVELIGGGESAGNYREIEIQNGEIATVNFR